MSQGRKPNRSGQGRQRNRRRYGGPRKANLIEQSKKELLEYNQRANDRLNYEKTGINQLAFRTIHLVRNHSPLNGRAIQ